MIVVDSSALCAVIFNEPEKSAFQAILDGEERCIVSAVNVSFGLQNLNAD
jgi:uncharacterized protein with PIN domain